MILTLHLDHNDADFDITNGELVFEPSGGFAAVRCEDPLPSGPYPASSHVETKAAAKMRDTVIGEGVIVINNTRGKCGTDATSPYGCFQVLPVILPHDATLVVWWPGSSGMINARFTGQ